MADPQLPIYCDYNATTPVDPLVLEAMLPYFGDRFGNPSSSSHIYGWTAQAAVDQARTTIATAIGALPNEIIFTSGATEANNLAIKGVAETSLHVGRHIVTVGTEHNAVLDPCHYLESLGFEVTTLPVLQNGLLNLAELERVLRADTILVSVMAANNEIGVLQPLEQIGTLLKVKQQEFSRKIPLHTDAAQALGKCPLDVNRLGLDLVSLTAHKLYGPKGVGGLFVRRRPPIAIAPQLHGGGQERGLRSGTLNPPSIVGFAKAVELGLQRMDEENQRLSNLRDRLWTLLTDELDGLYLNGDLDQRLAGNLNVSFAGVDGAALMLGIRNTVALSTGSACSSANPKPSHVLTALGRSPALAKSSLRFGLGRGTTVEEIDIIGQCIVETVKALRQSFVPHSP